MLRLLSALLLVALASASGQPSFRPSIRVVNGTSAVPHSWPWQAMVLFEQDGALYFICGGTLIDPDWVMTAGHCFPYNGTYWVLLGGHNITNIGGNQQIIPGEKIYVHPNYDDNNASKGNDIALLKLSTSAKLTDKVKPICPPPRDYILPHGTECYITGWGTTSTGGSIPDILQQGLLPVVDYAHCSQPDWWGSSVKETMVCAGGANVAGCNGDSGGPLNCPGVKCEWEVNGVASFVSIEGCDTLKKPTVFTRVSAYIDWIIGIIGGYPKCSC
ncbi:chymotrypsin-like elastase family member 3B [Lepus europaeus]|uniref:chymotrypsin-like elastase family member 3B n=1 Tax=Lepus europaeus TaxID=9983 RepID=UPI002B47E655|nr:chymotrypsin-like elastase family member 3B [Lepus europaeus]